MPLGNDCKASTFCTFVMKIKLNRGTFELVFELTVKGVDDMLELLLGLLFYVQILVTPSLVVDKLNSIIIPVMSQIHVYICYTQACSVKSLGLQRLNYSAKILLIQNYVVVVVHFTPYLSGLSSMMLIRAAGVA